MADEIAPEDKKDCKRFGKDVAWSVCTYLATAVLGALCAVIGIHPQKIIEKEVQYIVGNGVQLPDGEFKAFGWNNDPAAIATATKNLRFPVFAKTPAGEVADDELPAKAYMWDLAKKALGHHIPTRDQKSVGSCVAFGGIAAIEYLQVAQMVAAMQAGLPPPEFKDLAQEYSYGISRVQIGGGRLRGTDGSIGVWFADGVQKYGVVARGRYFNTIDLLEYNESRCRRYGDDGPPKELLPEGKLHLVKAYSPIKTTDELKRSLASGYPVSVASDVGFGNSSRSWVRDKDGVLQASGSWAHQMVIIGYQQHPTRGLLFCVLNSWGPSWVSGPKGDGEPPDGSFFVVAKTAQRMLDAGDSWSFSNLDGFKARSLDWFVKATPKQDRKLKLFDNLTEVAIAW